MDITNSKFYNSGEVEPKSDVQGTTRSGTLARKVGMLTLYDAWGMMVPVTVLHIDRCQVIQQFTEAKDGFSAVQVGAGEKYLGNTNKARMGHFMKAGVPPKLKVKQFDIDEENMLPLGFQLGARHYTVGQYVDTRSKAKDKGFSGAVKRWGFAGQSASHGTNKTHRGLGSTGQCQDAGRVFKGKRMHGHMGGHPRVVRNLRVYRIDYERNLVFLRGSVPGKKNDFVEISDSFFKKEENESMLNHPTFIPQAGVKYANIVQMEAPE